MSYDTVVLADGPIGYWKLTESVGASSFADSSGNGLSGTVDVAATAPVFGATGVLPARPADTAVHFAGRAAGLSILRVAGVGAFIDDSAGQSLEFWTHISADGDSGIWSWFQYGPSGVVPYNGAYRPNHAQYPCFSEAARQEIFGGEPLTADGLIHHVVYTRKTGGSFKYYVDGALVDTRTAGTYSHTANLLIGGDDVSGDPREFTGELGRVSLWNKELTAGQVAAHYAIGLSDSVTWAGSGHGASASAGHAAGTLLAETIWAASGHGASASGGRAVARAVLVGGTGSGASVSGSRASGHVVKSASASGHSVSGTGGAAASMSAYVPVLPVRPLLLGAGSYNGIVWGPGTSIRVVSVKGLDELPPARTTDQDRAGQPGARAGRDLYGPRTLTISFALLGVDNIDLRRILYAIERAWQMDGIDRPVSVFDGNRTITARVRNRAFGEAQGGRGRTASCDLMLWCGDPFYYEPPASVALAPNLATILTNVGDVEAPVRISLPGPVVNPTFSHDTLGLALWVNVALVDGDLLVLDSDNRTVLVNGQPNANLLDPLGRRWWDLQPGANQVRYSSASNNPAERATLTYSAPRL